MKILIAFLLALTALSAQTTINGGRVLNGPITGTSVQGTDTKLMTAGTVTGTGATLCTDALGGATTTGCSSGGGNTSTYGTCTATPSTSGRINGDQVKCSDSPYYWLLVSGSWQLRWNEYNVTAPPACASLTLINAAGSGGTCGATGPALTLTHAGSGACCNNYTAVQSAPSTPYSFTARLNVNSLQPANINVGIIMRDSGTSKFTALEFYNNGIRVQYWNSETSDNSTLASAGISVNTYGVLTLKISDNGTNRTYCASGDGVHFIQLFQEASNHNFTANQVGFVTLGWATNPNSVTWWDWTQSATTGC